MNEQDDDVKRLVKAALPPIENTDPRRDLWPELQRRLEAAPARFAWLDWLLAAGAAAWLLFFPRAIPALLYHL
jgi:hypothetical protein